MYILYQSIGDYSQTIRLGKVNEVCVIRSGETLYDGIAERIVDSKDQISFKDNTGKDRIFFKYVSIRLT